MDKDVITTYDGREIDFSNMDEETLKSMTKDELIEQLEKAMELPRSNREIT
jgi:hypothetical protein